VMGLWPLHRRLASQQCCGAWAHVSLPLDAAAGGATSCSIVYAAVQMRACGHSGCMRPPLHSLRDPFLGRHLAGTPGRGWVVHVGRAAAQAVCAADPCGRMLLPKQRIERVATCVHGIVISELPSSCGIASSSRHEPLADKSWTHSCRQFHQFTVLYQARSRNYDVETVEPIMRSSQNRRREPLLSLDVREWCTYR